jgi:hypothetical protein
VTAAQLTPLLIMLTAAAWTSFVVLGRAAYRKPRIGALTERTFIAFVLAVLGSISCVLRYNTDSGLSLFPLPVAALLFASTMLVVLAIPTAWLVLWLLGRLGQGE